MSSCLAGCSLLPTRGSRLEGGGNPWEDPYCERRMGAPHSRVVKSCTMRITSLPNARGHSVGDAEDLDPAILG